MHYVIDAPDAFGKALAEFRLLRGISQADLAAEVSLNRTYVSGLEQGTTTEALRRLHLIAEALDLRITIETRA